LVEPVPGKPQNSWITFLWQAKENTINVAIIDGVGAAIGKLDPAEGAPYAPARNDRLVSNVQAAQ
jgi:hypothetical protein